jgi:hypothetical protein
MSDKTVVYALQFITCKFFLVEGPPEAKVLSFLDFAGAIIRTAFT